MLIIIDVLLTLINTNVVIIIEDIHYRYYLYSYIGTYKNKGTTMFYVIDFYIYLYEFKFFSKIKNLSEKYSILIFFNFINLSIY